MSEETTSLPERLRDWEPENRIKYYVARLFVLLVPASALLALFPEWSWIAILRRAARDSFLFALLFAVLLAAAALGFIVGLIWFAKHDLPHAVTLLRAARAT